jgi:hypothetical protein
MGFISGEFIEKFGVSTTAQIRLDLKKYIPKNNMLLLGIICTHPTPIIELFLTRFG